MIHTNKPFSTLASLLLAFTLSGPLHAAVTLIDRVAVVVEDDIIMESEVRKRFDHAAKELVKRKNALPPENVLLREVVEQMILESIQLQMGQRAGVLIDDNRLNQAMSRIAQQNGLDLAQFKAALESEGLSYEDTREQIRREMITTRVREGSVGSRIQITDQEIRNYLTSEEGKARMEADVRVGHIHIPAPEDADSATMEAIKERALNVHSELIAGADFAKTAEKLGIKDGGDMGWRKASQVPSLFSEHLHDMHKGDIAEPIAASNGYHLITLLDKRGGKTIMVPQSKVRHILIKPSEIRTDEQARELLQELWQRIDAGEDFGELATQYSDDTGTLADGGDLGWMTGAELVPAFRKVMQESGVGVVSRPFRSQFGWHILEVTERREENMADNIKQRMAREVIFQRKFQDEVDLWLREERENAYVEIKIY